MAYQDAHDCDCTGWKLELNRPEKSQTFCVIWQTAATDNTSSKAVCILETLSWGFAKTTTMCWGGPAVLLGLHTRGSLWMCWRTEGWKCCDCATSTHLKDAAQALSSHQRWGEGDYAFPLLPWPHLLERALLSPLMSEVQMSDVKVVPVPPSCVVLKYLSGAGSIFACICTDIATV